MRLHAAADLQAHLLQQSNTTLLQPQSAPAPRRRPVVALDDGYLCARYISATLSLELEASLLAQVNAAGLRAERDALACAHATAAAMAAAREGLTPGTGARTLRGW